MPFHLCNYSLTKKYPSYEYQKMHEYEYKKFLKTLPTTHNKDLSEQSHRRSSYNNNSYFIRRQLTLQSREDKRKLEYERIQKDNLKFSQRLINAKAILNRNEQQRFFDKHCQLRQRLQRYPNLNPTKTKKADLQLLLNENLTMNKKSTDTLFLICNDNEVSQKSMQTRRKQSRMNHQPFTSKNLFCDTNPTQTLQRKLPRFIKEKSQFIETVSSITKNTDLSKKELKIFNTEADRSIDTIKWNITANVDNRKQCTKKLPSSQSSSTSSESNGS